MSPRELVAFVVRDFIDFVLHQKKWWLTILIIIVGAFIAFAVLSEPRAIRPLVYTDY